MSFEILSAGPVRGDLPDGTMIDAPFFDGALRIKVAPNADAAGGSLRVVGETKPTSDSN